ncbi:MAG: diguanylate cyclase [Campylobacterales bacterium]|nr:diguanylate cyclase [Campylobacterales bacterium]
MNDRILIVEDNKALAKLLAKKLQGALNITIDIAYTLQEAKLFTAKYKYFLSLLDINLPDAPNGEVVDYMLEKSVPVIVLSANIDKEFRQKILKKDIIDYVNKGGMNDVHYIIQTIERMQKNRKHKVLVVDDSMLVRKQVSSMLRNLFFEVVSVAHGEEALAMLDIHPNISLVLTDYNMPVMNGLELTYEIRKRYTKSDICILALSSNQDEEINALFLKQGANDYIKKPFSKEEFSVRINNSVEALENIQEVTNHANRDFLTGLYNRRYFYEAMAEYLEELEDSVEQFVIAMIDIDHFKKINDKYGHDVGDKVIVALSEILRTSTNHKDIVARFGGEEFCLVLKNINRYSAPEILERILQEVSNHVCKPNKKESIKFTISIGASMYDDTQSIEETISQADMMLYQAKNSGRNQLSFA